MKVDDQLFFQLVHSGGHYVVEGGVGHHLEAGVFVHLQLQPLPDLTVVKVGGHQREVLHCEQQDGAEVQLAQLVKGHLGVLEHALVHLVELDQ